MSSTVANKIKQQEEYEILKSMFDKWVSCDDSSEWLDVFVELSPLYDSLNPDVYAKIVLRVKCNENYPDRPPEIHLLNGKGLSKMQIGELHSTLEALANKLKGEVMIYQLTQCVQEFLLANNKPGTESFYDEMQKRQRILAQQKSRSEEDRISKEFQDIKEKVILKEAKAQFSDDGDNSSSSDDERANVIIGSQRRQVRWNVKEIQSYSFGDTDCDHHSCKYLQFQTKHLRGRCLEHDEHSVTYYGIDVSNGQPAIIREYMLKPQEKQTSKELLSAVPVLKQLEQMEKDLKKFINIRHENLMSFLDFKYIVEKDHIVVYLVQEFVSNINLSAYAKCDLTSDVAFIRCVIIGVLRALAFLHQHNILHKNVRNSSIYLSKTGIIKLGDFNLTKRMEELQLTCRQIEAGGGRCRSERTLDILQLGAVILGLLGLPADPVNRPVLSDQVSLDLRDFLDKCFLDDDRRWTARQLLEHSFVKASVAREPWKRGRRPSECTAGAEVEDDDDEEDTNQLINMLKIPNDLKNQSRLSCEFRVLKYLGSGSFGKVLKAKNKLDGGVYAIKAIELNPRKKNLNRKMIREVKLLSKLNHENVVRYYNSWIETTNVDDTSSVTQVTSTPIQSITEMQSLQGLEKSKLGIGALDEEEEESSDDDDDDDDDSDDKNRSSHHKSKIESEQSESIVFEESKAINLVDSAVDLDESPDAEDSKQRRVLYIQMEFCERSTLRLAIDEGGLNEDIQRYWRLVREIIEGLAYIHEQDMIHRDLKPVNIFLDSRDHVKIGDFGLATTSILPRNTYVTNTVNVSAAESEGSSHIITEDSHTGGVGTSFYVASELQKITGKAHYNRKVDIYSLGIILFEMTHPPFSTAMERCKMLSNLRLPEIVAPPYMDENFPQQMNLIRMLLDHDPVKRPTCQDILSGNWLPPPQVEESEVQDFIKHTLSNPQSKAYKYLISSCFNQKASIAEDLTYHMDSVGSAKHYALQETVRDTLIKIMRRYGACSFSTPLFLHISQKTLLGATNYVQLMTHSGTVVLAPRDLRVPLARLLANRCIINMRRYCVDRVYKERRTHGFHPRESLECAFDIVTPNPGDLVGDAEMFGVLQEIINELPTLKTFNCFLRVNHTLLLEAVLISLNLQNMYSTVFQILNDARDSKSAVLRLTSRLENAQINSQVAKTLANIFKKEDILNEVFREIHSLVKRREEAISKAKRAFDQLKTIFRHADAMGCKIPIKICPGLVNTSECCSGIMFDLVCLVRQKKKDGYEILATGCRYDELIAQFRKPFELTGGISRDFSQSAVGMSVAIDKIVSLLKEDSVLETNITTVVCSLGRDLMMNIKTELVGSFRTAGISSYILENVETIEDVDMYGRDHLISHIIWLKESEKGTVRVRSWERDRYIEKKMPLDMDTIVRAVKVSSDANIAASKPLSADSSLAQDPRISILNNDKMPANTRRIYENQIKCKIAQFCTNFSSKAVVEVMGVFLDMKVIMSIANNLDFSDDANDFTINTQNLVERYPRHKAYLIKVCDKISCLSTVKKNLVLVLYSLLDDKFKQVI